MKSRNRRIAFFSAISMLILILDGKSALRGAVMGINLCVNSLIPSLFPFFVLSILLTGALSGEQLKCIRPICKIIGIPRGAESLIAVGILGGYPVGAQSVSLLHQQGQIDSYQAMRLLAFCNNAGPAFIFGVLGSMFSSKLVPWLLWTVHIISALLVGIMLPAAELPESISNTCHKIRITDALSQAVKTMSLVCGWVICVRVILELMESWFLTSLPLPAQILITGILELSNGCLRLAELEYESIRFLISSFLLPLGGLCVALQTAAVAEGISMKMYFPGKILQCGISILLSSILQFLLPFRTYCPCSGAIILSIVIIITISAIFRYYKKTVEFQHSLMYNRFNKTKEVSLCFFAKE